MQVGHKYALGNTEEDLVRKNLGFAERGLEIGRKCTSTLTLLCWRQNATVADYPIHQHAWEQPASLQ